MRDRLTLSLATTLLLAAAPADAGEFYVNTGYGNCCSGDSESETEESPVCIPQWAHTDGVGAFAANGFASRGALSGLTTHTHIGVVGDYSAGADMSMEFDDLVFESPGSDPIAVRWNLVIEAETNNTNVRYLRVAGSGAGPTWDGQIWNGVASGAFANWDGMGTLQFQSPEFTVPVNTPVSLKLLLTNNVAAGSVGVNNRSNASLTLPPKGDVFTVPAGVTVQSDEARIEDNRWKAGVIRVPKDFGTIQAAIDAAGSKSRIRIKGGTYLENLVIDCAKDLTLEVDKGKVVIDAGVSPSGIIISESSGVTIRGLTVTGGTAHGIDVRDSSNTTISKCKIEGAALDGVHAETSDDLRVEKVAVSNVAGAGVYVEDCDRATVTKTTVTDAQGGIYVVPMSETSTAPVVTNNTVSSVQLDGIGVVGPGAVVTGNNAKKCVQAAVAVESDGATVTGNKASKSGAGVVAQGDDVTANKNKASACGVGFVFVGDSFTANKNTAAGCEGDAFMADTTNSSFAKNQSTKAAGHGFLVTGTDNEFNGNKATKSGQAGFRVTASKNTFLKNVAKKSGTFDLSDTVGGNTYTSNKFETVE